MEKRRLDVGLPLNSVALPCYASGPGGKVAAEKVEEREPDVGLQPPVSLSVPLPGLSNKVAAEKIEERELDVGLQPSFSLSIALPCYPSGSSDGILEGKVEGPKDYPHSQE